MRSLLLDRLEPYLGDPLASFLVPRSTTLLVAAIGVVLWVMLVRGRRVGLSPRHIVGSAATGVIVGLVGARVLFLMQDFTRTMEHPRALLHLCGGTMSWGAYLFGTLGYCAYLARGRQPLLVHADILAASLGLGPAIARLACLMSGCCWGALSDLPWAIRFPEGSPAFFAQQQAGLVGPDALRSLPIHPVQIYASLAGVCLFVVASAFWRRFRHRPGLSLAFYWMLYGALRFTTEFYRGDGSRIGALRLTQSQHLALLICVVAGLLLWWMWRRPIGLEGVAHAGRHG